MSSIPRPPVAVVLPFHGDPSEADSALAQLGRLKVRAGDEVVLADNTPQAVAGDRYRAEHVRVIECEIKKSAYAARNIGAERTAAPWILFVDADCRLSAELLDSYFEPAPARRCGAVAGQVLGVPDQPGIVPSYVRSRRHLDQEQQLKHPFRPMAVTANLLVRREAWEELGGFAELTRAGGADSDFCWRLQDAGWTLEYRPRALVLHEHRATLRALLKQARRDGSTAPWLARRHDGCPPRLPWRVFARSAAGAIAWPLLGQPRRGLFKAIDGIWAAAFNLGSVIDDAAQNVPPAPELVVLLEEFPSAGDPLVPALAAASSVLPGLHVEAIRRPNRAAWREGRRVSMRHWEDDNALTRIRSARPRLPGRARPPAAPAWRLARARRTGLLLVEPSLEGLAARLAAAAGREDLRIEVLPSDRGAAAERIVRLGDGAARLRSPAHDGGT